MYVLLFHLIDKKIFLTVKNDNLIREIQITKDKENEEKISVIYKNYFLMPNVKV